MPAPRREGGIIKLAAVSVCLSVCLSVCPVPRPNSRTERPRKHKICRMEVHHTSNMWTYLEVKRSKVSGRLMLKPKVCRLRTLKLVGGWCMRYQLPWPAIKACEVARGRGHTVSAAPGGGHTTCFSCWSSSVIPTTGRHGCSSVCCHCCINRKRHAHLSVRAASD